MKRFLIKFSLVASCAVFIGAVNVSVASAQNIFVTPDGNGSSSSQSAGDTGGKKKSLFVPQDRTTARPSPGAERRGFDVYTPSGGPGFRRDKSSREAERFDIFDQVQQKNIDMASEQSAQNMKLIEQQRQARIAQRQQQRAAADAEAEARIAANNRTAEEDLPPEYRKDQQSVMVDEEKVIITKKKDSNKLDKPPRIFNTFD